MKPEDTPVDMSHYHRDRWDGDMDPTAAELWAMLAAGVAALLSVCGLAYWWLA